MVAIACLGLLVALQMPTAAAVARRAQSSLKDADGQRLVELAQTIQDLKARLANDPTNVRLQSRLNAATSEYDAVSARLGGYQAPGPDLPGSADRGNPTPPLPTGCTSAVTSVANNTPTPIPDNNTTGATSTINVAGAGTFVYDVNVTVAITHTFNSDISFTLTSPAGTTVTLSSNNDGSADNVFNGTTFDDQADPDSQIPYAVNPNIVSDHTYTNNVIVPTLTPEEPLSAFNGQNPNGTWTIKLVDNAGGDTGTLNSWSLNITTLTSTPVNAAPVTVANNTPTPIPDNNTTGATSTINIAGAGATTCDVNVTVAITHTFNSDISFTLTSPTGQVVTLASNNDGSADNVFNGTTFNDQADPNSQIPYAVNPNIVSDHTYTNNVVVPTLTPVEPLSAFNGQNPNGTWTIKLVDNAGGDTGTLNSWSLSVVTCQCPVVQACTIFCPPPQMVTATTPTGAVVNYPAPTTAGNCGTVTCAPASGTMFPTGTTTVTCTEQSGMTTVTTTVYSSGNVAVPIPDNNATGGSVTINVPDMGPVVDVNVRVRLNHTFDSDLAIGLSHANSGNALSNNNGGSGDNYGTGTNDCAGTKTIFDDSAGTLISAGTAPFAGTFKPQSGLSIYNGSDASGAWTLKVVDSVGLDSGTIGCFELEITRQVSVPTMNSCSFPVTVSIPFDSCCVDDYSGDTFQTVVANATPGSPLYGFWQYHVAATGETFSGTANSVAFRPGLSLVERDSISPNVAMYAQIDFIRKTCLVQVTDRTTGRQFTLRDRNITNSTCGPAPPPAD